MAERQIFSNAIGTVTDKRVMYKKGSVEVDLPIRHITSVRTYTKRSIGLGLFLAFTGLVAFGSGGGAVLVGLVLLALAVLCLWGSPRVVLNTAGTDVTPASAPPWMRADASNFAAAVRGQLFD